jgi:DNA-binding NtrC family response regulator
MSNKRNVWVSTKPSLPIENYRVEKYFDAMAILQRAWLLDKLNEHQTISETARVIGLSRRMLTYLVKLHSIHT